MNCKFSCVNVLYGSLKYYNLFKPNSLVKKGKFIFVIKKGLMLKKTLRTFYFRQFDFHENGKPYYKVHPYNIELKLVLKVNNNYL